MIARSLVVACILGSAAAGGFRPSRADEFSLRFDPVDQVTKTAVVVRGIDAENLARLSDVDWTPDRWARLLALSVDLGTGKTPLPVSGTYRVAGETLRFEPRFPIESDLKHVARFDPASLPIPQKGPSLTTTFRENPSSKASTTTVARVEPSGDVLPENLLKFYIHFSAPMSRGEVYDRVRLVDVRGKTVEAAFLELGEELWNPAGTRITLLLDPGRIKRGLVPHEEDGPILVNGNTYTLQIDRQWPDAEGRPMRVGFAKTFRAGPVDRTQPDPKTWDIGVPLASSRLPLEITFPEPLDRAMLDRAIEIRDDRGRAVAGEVAVDDDSTVWRFTPKDAWQAGSYEIVVDPELEDLAGNSVARPFEVDAQAPATAAKPVRLKITVPSSRP